jgi:hypothetical protein
MVEAQKFAFNPLREKLRKLVASRDSDLRYTTNSSVGVTLPPKAFFIAFSAYAATANMTSTKVSVLFRSARELDFIFPPTDDDLAVDGIVHPYFGHPVLSRWHEQTFDDPNAVDQDPDTALDIRRSLYWKVKDDLFVIFHRRSNTFCVQCTWVGAERRAGHPNAKDEQWRVDELGGSMAPAALQDAPSD